MTVVLQVVVVVMVDSDYYPTASCGCMIDMVTGREWAGPVGLV